jgi:septum formation protein
VSPALLLASASPRRRELLARAGVPFVALASDVDERPRPGEEARAYAERLAEAKARAAANGRDFVLGADTVVVVDGDVLGKATDEEEARGMLVRLSGRAHEVLTACCLLAPDGTARRLTVSTEVVFRALSAGEVAGYLASGEWRGKAGAYAVQGIAAAFIPEVRGSYTNVVGLPLAEVVALLGSAGAPGADPARGVPA